MKSSGFWQILAEHMEQCTVLVSGPNINKTDYLVE